jgi:hypothetical protein
MGKEQGSNESHDLSKRLAHVFYYYCTKDKRKISSAAAKTDIDILYFKHRCTSSSCVNKVYRVEH